jgi:hypothetical protein
VNDPVAMTVDYNSAQNVGNFLYMAKADGTMAVFCIMPGQQINAASRFETEGKILDVANVYGDTYILVDRDDVLYLEKLDYKKTDCTITKIPDNNGVIEGLDDYNGYFVHVYTDDCDLGEYFVIGGRIKLSPDFPDRTPLQIGITYDYKMISTRVAVDGQTGNIEKRIAKATVTTHNTKKLNFCGQTLRGDNDVYDFYGVGGYARDCRFWIEGAFDPVEILSIVLNINYGEK